jgi:hypothetical protein
MVRLSLSIQMRSFGVQFLHLVIDVVLKLLAGGLRGHAQSTKGGPLVIGQSFEVYHLFAHFAQGQKHFGLACACGAREHKQIQRSGE